MPPTDVKKKKILSSKHLYKTEAKIRWVVLEQRATIHLHPLGRRASRVWAVLPRRFPPVNAFVSMLRAVAGNIIAVEPSSTGRLIKRRCYTQWRSSRLS